MTRITSRGAWPTDMPDDVLQHIVGYIPFLERMKLRSTSQQFQHVIDSMHWPTLEFIFTETAGVRATYSDDEEGIITISNIDYGSFLQMNLQAPRPPRLIVELGDAPRATLVLSVMQHLARNFSDTVTDLAVHRLDCNQASTVALRETFARFSSVTRLAVFSEASPSCVLSTIAAFQSLTSLDLDMRPSAAALIDDIDQFSGSKLGFLSPKLTELFIRLEETFYGYNDLIYLRSIMSGISENVGLKKLASEQLFDYWLIRDEKDQEELLLLHQAFARMIIRLVNLEELSSIPNPDAKFWQDVMECIRPNHMTGTTVKRLVLSFPLNAPLCDFEALAKACNQVFPRLEELHFDEFWYRDDLEGIEELYDDEGELDEGKVLSRVANGLSSLVDHPSLSKISFDFLNIEEVAPFMTGLEAKLGGNIKVTDS